MIFEVETDGGEDAEYVFREAVKTFYEQLSIFNRELALTTTSSVVVADANDDDLKKLLVSIDDLNFSARSHNCLTRSYIKYLGDLVLMSEKELSDIKNLGKKSLDEIKDKMEELGYPVNSVLPDELATQLKAKLAQLKDKV